MLDSIKHFLKLGQYDNAKQCMDFYEQQSGIASSEVVAPGYESYYMAWRAKLPISTGN